jgi:hypothetical protein
VNQFGKDWRVHIKSAATFIAIGGETSFDWKRSSAEQDLSDKDSGVYGATSYGQQKINFSISGNLKLPDPGLELASDTSKASPPQVEIKVMNGAIVKFHGLVAIGNFSSSFPTTGPATFSLDAVNAAAPIVDDLGADS